MLAAQTLDKSFIFKKAIPSLAVVSVIIANIMVFLVVPNEKVMGAVQRIFYFHVGAAMSSYLMIALLLLGSIMFLATRKPSWDFFSASAAGVAFALCTIVLLSGMIWGQSAWNTWWRWEPRLVTFLVLWLILLSYVTFRNFLKGEPKCGGISAVLGILSAVFVPIVVFSIKLLDQSEQLHPEVVANQGLKDPRFTAALLWSIGAMALVSVWFMVTRLNLYLLSNEIDEHFALTDREN